MPNGTFRHQSVSSEQNDTFWAFQNFLAENLEIAWLFWSRSDGVASPNPKLRIRQNLSRRRQRNLALSAVAFPDYGFRYSNPVLHGVPLFVIPNEQIFLRALRALDQAFAVRVDFAVFGELLKRCGHDSRLQEETGKQNSRIARRARLQKSLAKSALRNQFKVG
jgi:hypothetical protein